MAKLRSALVVSGLLAAGFMGLVGCGSDDDTQGDRSVKIGSVLPDSYDPVLFEKVQATQPLQLVYTGLLTYKHADGAEGTKIIPGLAEAMPEVSADKKTYTFKLREGLKYSDGTAVKASDFEHTIKRLNFLGGPFLSFTSQIEGISEYQDAKKSDADISGITADDATGEITVKLSVADGRFLNAIALPNAAPTPASKAPFKASRSIPGIGPYTIEVVNPTREFILTKTPGFDIPGIAKGNIDTFTVTRGSVAKVTQDVIDNKLDFMTEDPTGDLLAQVKSRYSSRFRMDASPPNIYRFFLNETVKPFSSLEARQAVNHAIDSRALQRIFGGRLEPTCNLLPPSYAKIGYEKIDPCPYGDPAGPPNMAKARELIEKSGMKGEEVVVWGPSDEPRPAIVEYLRDVLTQLGFKAKTRILDEAIYYEQVGNRKTKAQAGFTNWFQDFPHPAVFFEPNLSAAALRSSPTTNFQHKSDPRLDAALKKLNPEADASTVAGEWAKVDKLVVDQALGAIYGNELSTSFFSERMDFENCAGVHPVYKNDWALFCLKRR